VLYLYIWTVHSYMHVSVYIHNDKKKISFQNKSDPQEWHLSMLIFVELNKTNEVKFWLTIYSYFDVLMIMVIIFFFTYPLAKKIFNFLFYPVFSTTKVTVNVFYWLESWQEIFLPKLKGIYISSLQLASQKIIKSNRELWPFCPHLLKGNF